MAHINFLEPPKFNLRQFNLKNFELNYFWLMTIAGSMLILMFLYGIIQRYRVGSLNKAVAIATTEAQKARGAGQAKPGATPASILSSLQHRVLWSPVINAVANQTPDTIALNYIKGSAAARTVGLEGLCADVASASHYTEDLSTIPLLAKVTLQSISTSAASKAGADKEKLDEKDKPKGKSTERILFDIEGRLK
ncbi:MAG: hypothetical protein COV45_00160 [Deltaproteobacteria bacterium CG11_big_fil_rev_8_21_14_0_20_47_16]|nr:MAG: hypothetical protein COV45_00160 [Deltaproteobacteria bacterium CG11_big_fil_rev_8_21_14_0_20_47_16]